MKTTKTMKTMSCFKSGRIEIVFGFLSLLLLAGCETGSRNYSYVVKNSTNTTGTFLLSYTLNGVAGVQEKWLEPEESFVIYERNEVSGSDIWDIETSSTIYAVPTITAKNHDGTRMTEELARRIYWSLPEEQKGKGVFTLNVTDDMFVMERQAGYKYYIHNALDDSIFVTTQLLSDPQKIRDTLIAGQTVNIGETEIYTYTEDFRDTDKYIENKLSGISSLSIKYGERNINLNFKKHKELNLQIEQQQCTITADQSILNQK